MHVVKNEKGTYYAQQKVPERLHEAVARAVGKDRGRCKVNNGIELVRSNAQASCRLTSLFP
jgi:hypothetical protein